MTSCVYLLVYFVQSYTFGGNYEGNKIGASSFFSVIEIIIQLIKSGIPGYYLVSPKYQGFLSMTLNETNIIDNYVSLRIVIILLSSIICLCFIFRDIKSENNSSVHLKKIILVSLCFMYFIIAPTIPNSISSMYQGIVNDTSFTALPCSYFIWQSIVGLIAYILWVMFVKYKKRFIFLLAGGICLSVGIGVQIMGEKVLLEEKNTWKQYLVAEKFLGTNLVRQASGSSISASDMYGILGMRPTYWEMTVAGLYDMQINFFNEEKGKYPYNIYWPNKEYFVFSNSEQSFLALEESSNIPKLVKIGIDEYAICDMENGYWDNGFAIYPID